MDLFSSRELATGIWIAIFLAFALLQAKTRNSFAQVIKAFFQAKILGYIIISSTYYALILLLVNQYFAISASLLKDAILWFISSGLLLTASTAPKGNVNLLSKHLYDNLRLTIVFEFIIATYVFPLMVELAIIALATIIATAAALSAHKRTTVIQSVFGISITIFVMHSVCLDYSRLTTLSSIKIFILPLILMILYLPAAYAWSIVTKYEAIFTRIENIYRNTSNESVGKYLKKRIIQLCGLNLKKIESIEKFEYGFWHYADTIEKVDEYINCNANKTKYEEVF